MRNLCTAALMASSVQTPEDSDDNFWLVDNCEDCGQPLESMTVRILD